MVNSLIGYAVKIVGSIFLGPIMGGYGFVLASTLCFLLITVLNLRAISSKVKLIVLGKRWTSYLVTIILTAAQAMARI